MAKDKKQFYEEMEFDNVQYAIDVVNAHKVVYEKAKKGLHLSIFATIYNLIGWAIVANLLLLVIGDVALDIALISVICFSLASYIVGGGLGTAIKWAFKLGAFGWIILPFPWDLITGFFLMVCAGMFFFFVPVIFVYMNYKQIKMDYQAAKKYISYYKAKPKTTTTVQENRLSRNNNLNREYENSMRSQSNAGSGYSRTNSGIETGRTYGSATRGQLNSSAGYNRTGSNTETGRTYGSTTRSQTGSSSSYSRTGGYSGTRNYR